MPAKKIQQRIQDFPQRQEPHGTNTLKSTQYQKSHVAKPNRVMSGLRNAFGDDSSRSEKKAMSQVRGIQKKKGIPVNQSFDY